MADSACLVGSMFVGGRSYIAFVLTPEAPVLGWLADLDASTRRSGGFFVGKPVVLDLSTVVLGKDAIAQLVAELQTRDIRIMGIEGVDPAEIGPELPPVLKDGWTAAAVQPSNHLTHTKGAPTVPVPPQGPSSLLLEGPVRSGQSVVFTNGDVTVLGSVASGAQIIAGGSIHVYGTLRGRVLAGSNGNRRARIFCKKAEAELLAIDGFYRTAEGVEPSLRGRPIQVWLQNQVLSIAALD
jgi:septum site-determining protein MinC